MTDRTSDIHVGRGAAPHGRIFQEEVEVCTATSAAVPAQASNVATYIAHGDVALSVLMTTASTLGAIIMTPLLTKFLAGTLVPVDAKAISAPLMSLPSTLLAVSLMGVWLQQRKLTLECNYSLHKAVDPYVSGGRCRQSMTAADDFWHHQATPGMAVGLCAGLRMTAGRRNRALPVLCRVWP